MPAMPLFNSSSRSNAQHGSKAGIATTTRANDIGTCMISFRKPLLKKTHSGHVCIELTEAGTWEQFPEFAEKLTKQLHGRKIKAIDSPDIRFWEIRINNIILNLGYEDYPNGISLFSYCKDGDAYLQNLHKELLKNSGEPGSL
ncbi:DUF3630 family protein [Thiorhodovibrio frisius]|uniref:DUF3630 family protein n=1 Tax=Thiorhodovibrio frisius TaxID=631362 RepID=UPI000A032067|nr:DUF3630 family protein [Thiorhodovibrio frisius]